MKILNIKNWSREQKNKISLLLALLLTFFILFFSFYLDSFIDKVLVSEDSTSENSNFIDLVKDSFKTNIIPE